VLPLYSDLASASRDWMGISGLDFYALETGGVEEVALAGSCTGGF